MADDQGGDIKNEQPPFSVHERENLWSRLEKNEWELVIIGGGITGAACAREAALRGIPHLLLEADDFASATSSGSSKLIHGGLRYLQNLEFQLVYSAIRERERLQKLYAPFIQELPFVFPTYKKRKPSYRTLNFGLWIYDSFSMFRRRHRSYRGKRAQEKFPLLKPEALSGACVYTDGFSEDYRLVIELIKASARNGGSCLSRAKVKHIQTESDGRFQIQVQDQWEQGRQSKLRARHVLNCAGPFSDHLRQQLQLDPRLYLTQGVHFVVPRAKLPLETAYVLSDPDHDRILFAIPWNQICFLGTTDTAIDKPQKARASKEDLNYILDIYHQYFSLPLKQEDIVQSWAGVRPLLHPSANTTADGHSKISREHRLEEEPTNFFHLLGGKLTSHRIMAEEALNTLSKRLGMRSSKASRTHPLQEITWREPCSDHLGRTYGYHRQQVLKYDEQRQLSQKRISQDHPQLVAELIFSIRHEMTLSPLDFLRRRSNLYYQNPKEELIDAVCDFFRIENSWDEQRFRNERKRVFDSYQWDCATWKSGV